MTSKRSKLIALLTFAFASATSLADYTIDWHTINGGGGRSTGSNFEVVGTLGQPDAGPGSAGMSGGSFELTGGFWAGTAACSCPGDTNGDGEKDGRDMQQFVDCLVAGGACPCGNVDGVGGTDLNDVAVFVNDLLTDSTCP